MTAGTVLPGYEPVRAAFEAGAGTFGRGGGAFCAYVDGKPVVDLWGGTAQPGSPWEAGTTTVIMSATKGLASLCLQVLADRGQLDLDAPVVRYWPEFGQNGKERTLVRHITLHTAGVLSFPGDTDLLQHDGTGWDDYDAIAAGLAAATPEWEPGSKHGYHALTYGWLAAVLVRRVSGRSVGAFFDEEVAKPLGLECWIGTPISELGRVARVHKATTSHLPGVLRKAVDASERLARDPSTMSGVPSWAPTAPAPSTRRSCSSTATRCCDPSSPPAAPRAPRVRWLGCGLCRPWTASWTGSGCCRPSPSSDGAGSRPGPRTSS